MDFAAWQNIIEDSQTQRYFYISVIVLSLFIVILSIVSTVQNQRNYQFIEPSSAAIQPRNGAQMANVSNTQAAQLFGVYQAKASSVAAVTDLNWKLLGVFISPNNKQSNAVIEDGSGEQHQYRIDDEIENGITLKSVRPDRVILLRDGKLEALLLDPEGLENAPINQQLFDFNEIDN